MDILVILSLGLMILGTVLLTTSRKYQVSARQTEAAPASFRPGKMSLPGTFLKRVVVYGFLLRLSIVAIFHVTDAIRVLHLSPDSLRYHREGLFIAHEMSLGYFNWPNWIDNGWFQFTGLVYYMFGPHPFVIQFFNITLGAVTPVIVYKMLRKVYADERVARWSALFTAFFPSFVYWSCLMLKDPLSIFAMSLLVLSVVSLRNRFHIKWLVSMLFSLLVFLSIREYMFFIGLFFIAASFLPTTGWRVGPMLTKLLIIVIVVGSISLYMGFGFMGREYIAESQYFDINYINETRIKMGGHGTGAFFEDPSSALWGSDFWSNFKASAVGIFFFFFTIDFTRLGSVRQLMALPEVLIFVSLLPALWRGMLDSWRNHREATLPLFVFALGIMVVYGSATTNMGAMFRWRMQAMPFFLAFLAHGLLLRSSGFYFRLLSRLRI